MINDIVLGIMLPRLRGKTVFWDGPTASKPIICVMGDFQNNLVHIMSKYCKLRKNRSLRDCVSIRKSSVCVELFSTRKPCLVLSLIPAK